MLAAGVDPDTLGHASSIHSGRTALGELCLYVSSNASVQQARFECIKVLLDAGASPNAHTEFNEPPLIHAAIGHDVAIVNVLLAAGADPRYASSRHGGWSAIHAAAAWDSCACATALLKAGADVEGLYRNTAISFPITPLMQAVYSGHRRIIPVLLRGGARLDMTGIAALPGAHYSLAQEGAVPSYIAKVDAAGGWKKYEQAHRTRLTTTFTRVLFPRLPIAAISNIVCSWAHVGFY